MKIDRRSSACKSVFLLLLAVLALSCWLGPTAEASSPWSAPAQVYTTSYQWLGYGLSSVSCPTTTFCAAVDDESSWLSYNGSSWSGVSPAIAGYNNSLRNVSCPTSSFCVATDGGSVLTYNGSSWSAPGFVDHPYDYLTSLSCPTTTFCAAVDNGGYALTYNGSSWSAPVNISYRLSSVSCVSSSFCVAGDETGNVFTWNGSSWSAPVSIFGPSGYLLGLSCPSTSFCVAVTNYGYALTYNGNKWSEAVRIGSYDLYSVSCPSATFCVAVGEGNNAYIYNGSSWSTFTGIDSNGGMKVSCPTATFCVAVDFKGYALTYTGEPVPVNISPPTIAGITTQGQNLTELHGAWSHNPYEYGYQWERCSSSGSSCEAIAGAVSPTYLLTASDVGHTVRVTETASNASGAGVPASSAVTSVIQAESVSKKETKQPIEGKGGKNHKPPVVVQCIVPNLKGKSLVNAGSLLVRAHCKLGKVSFHKKHGKHRRHKLVVVSQNPGSGKVLPLGAKVAVRLG